MGCINSKKKLTEVRCDNVIRVRVIQLPTARNGFLELNPQEVIFYSQYHGQQSNVVWALQHLRRYGLNGDLFSFEAGRRCMTGPGVYTFRCTQADRLYQQFQRYVNEMSLSMSDDVFSRDRDQPSNTLGSSELINPYVNNYLEPAPLNGMAGMRPMAHEAFGSNPISLDQDSPDSVPSISFTNEVVHFQNHSNMSRSSAYVNTSSNVYLEHPLRPHLKRNNNNNNNKMNHTVSIVNCGNVNSTLSNISMVKHSSLDIPPDECAPILMPQTPVSIDSLHMYANIDTINTNFGNTVRESDGDRSIDTSERCYENLTRGDLAKLFHLTAAHNDNCNNNEQQLLPSSPDVSNQAVNYIVLDLDQPRSPTQSSPKTCFGSGLSITGDNSEAQILPASNIGTTSTNTITLNQKDTMQCQQQQQQQQSQQQQQQQSQQLQKTESTLGYSTIDFIKTYALIKSTAQGSDLDPADSEELRITRHSKCVRKAYSISE